MTMPLPVTIRRNGTEEEVDLAAMKRMGQYYYDQQRDLIIKVTAHGPEEEAGGHVPKTVICASGVTIRPVDVDKAAVRTQIEAELQVDVRDEEVAQLVEEYRQRGVQVIAHWAGDLRGFEILSYAEDILSDRRVDNSNSARPGGSIINVSVRQYSIVSLDIERPLERWVSSFDEIVARATTHESRQRENARTLLNALRDASPGDSEFSARIELVDTTSVTQT